MSTDIKSLVRRWLLASPSARSMKFSPSPLPSSFSPRPERLGLGAAPPQDTRSSVYDKQLEKRVRRKVVGKKIQLDTTAESEVVAHDQTEPSSDEECSRSRSVHRPRTAAGGRVVEGVESSGRRNRRKRRRHQKTLLSPTPLSSDSRRGGGSSLSSKNARDEQEKKGQATHVPEHGSLQLGSEFRDIHKLTPPSTYHGSTNTDVPHTNISPDPAQEMSNTKVASPVPLSSLTSQCRKDLLRGGSSCTPVTSDDTKQKRHQSAHWTVEGHTMTASSHEEARTEVFECGTCMRTEEDGMLQGNSGGKEEGEKTQNASVQTSPISSRKPHRIPRRRRLRWACVHRGQSLPWSTPPRKFRQRHKHNDVLTASAHLEAGCTILPELGYSSTVVIRIQRQ